VTTAFYSIQRSKLLLRLGRPSEAERALRAGGEVVLARTPVGHAYRAQLDFVRGLLAMAQGDPREAGERFTHLRETSDRLPTTHPESAGLDCALGIALFRQGRQDEAAGLMDQCPRYATWGLAEPLLLGWYREARPRR
jgi:Flp pilus assembly protein TadD